MLHWTWAQAVEYLLYKHETVSSNPSLTKKKLIVTM
jgi:hypothetical protein